MSRCLSIVVMLGFVCISCVGCSPEAQKEMADAAAAKTGDAMDAAQSGMSDMMGKATEALSSVEGGSDMLKQVTDLFGSATKTFSSVTDETTANAALPDISKLTESFGGLGEMYAKLPDAAKTAVGGVIQNALGEFKPMLEKVLAIPGVEAILKPAVDALLQKLSAFQA